MSERAGSWGDKGKEMEDEGGLASTRPQLEPLSSPPPPAITPPLFFSRQTNEIPLTCVFVATTAGAVSDGTDKC